MFNTASELRLQYIYTRWTSSLSSRYRSWTVHLCANEVVAYN